jgi:hypothetical protein
MCFFGPRTQILTALAALVCGCGFMTPGANPSAKVAADGRGDLAFQSGQPDPAQVQIATLTTETTDEDDSFVARSVDPHGPLGAGPRCGGPHPRASHASCRRLLRRAPKTSPPR